MNINYLCVYLNTQYSLVISINIPKLVQVPFPSSYCYVNIYRACTTRYYRMLNCNKNRITVNLRLYTID